MLTFSTLNLCSVNVRGLRDNIKRKALFLYMRRQNANLLFFLQETHSSSEDVKFWNSQWGENIYYSHGTNNSAGVAILFNNFNGTVLDSKLSKEGRWIILTLKVDNINFIICNVYGPNRNNKARDMFEQLNLQLLKLRDKYKGAIVVVGGDFNDVLDENLDRHPPRLSLSRTFKATSYLCQNHALTDAWRFMNGDKIDFTWSNSSHTLQSRIDSWLLSSKDIDFIAQANHKSAPLSDHKLINLNLKGTKETSHSRGYWKLNNTLLKDQIFKDRIEQLTKDIFNRQEMDNVQKWEYFKYKVRGTAIERSKVIKKEKSIQRK